MDEKIPVIDDGIWQVSVRPNAPKTRVLLLDQTAHCLEIAIAASAQEGKANEELVRFLHKLTHKQVRILKGFTTRHKVIEFFG